MTGQSTGTLASSRALSNSYTTADLKHTDIITVNLGFETLVFSECLPIGIPGIEIGNGQKVMPFAGNMQQTLALS